jgi:hypothetical protein
MATNDQGGGNVDVFDNHSQPEYAVINMMLVFLFSFRFCWASYCHDLAFLLLAVLWQTQYIGYCMIPPRAGSWSLPWMLLLKVCWPLYSLLGADPYHTSWRYLNMCVTVVAVVPTAPKFCFWFSLFFRFGFPLFPVC